MSSSEQPGPAETLESPAAQEQRIEHRASHAWRALRHRNFQLFVGGQSISLIGTWMTRVATGWLVYRLTGSALLLGTVSFAGQIPTFLLAPFAGVWVDRLDRRQVLVWTQTLAMVQSLLLAALTLSGRVTVHWVLALSAMQGIINAFDMPGRQAFLVQMVEDRRDLGNAIAINSSMVNMARLIGPSLAGLVIAASSEGWCFLIDGVSYLAVIASLLMMRIHIRAIDRSSASMLHELREGWNYVSRFVPIRTILSLFALVSLMGMPFVVLMPIFAARVLHGGPHTLGFLMGAMGSGALVAALSLAARRSVLGLGRIIAISAAVFGIGADRLWPFPRLLALHGHDAGGGLRHDAGHGRQQHHHPDRRHRRQARPRHELLHHRLRGHVAVRQLARRSHGARRRRAQNGHPERRRGAARRGLVRLPAARRPSRHPAHLSRTRHPPGRSGRRHGERQRQLA